MASHPSLVQSLNPTFFHRLDVDCDKIKTFSQAVDYHQIFAGGDLYTGKQFFTVLNNSGYSRLWIMVFSATNTEVLRVPVTRLLYSLGSYLKAKKKKRMEQIHSKLYLGFSDTTLVDTYLGSQNLVNPTTANLMFRLSKEYNNQMKTYFEHFWEQ